MDDAASKYDIKRAHPELYAPGARDFALVEVPPQQALAVDGHGDPNTAAEYTEALEALYPVAYAVKGASKRSGRDFVVPPLEGLWHADDPSVFVTRDKGAWDWTMLLVLPDWIAKEAVAAAIETTAAKKPLPALPRLRLLRLHEGPSVQILHRGPYDDEGPILRRLHEEYLPAHGLTFAGHHHEIYLSDPRRTPPETLKTVLRQPVRPLA